MPQERREWSVIRLPPRVFRYQQIKLSWVPFRLRIHTLARQPLERQVIVSRDEMGKALACDLEQFATRLPSLPSNSPAAILSCYGYRQTQSLPSPACSSRQVSKATYQDVSPSHRPRLPSYGVPPASLPHRRPSPHHGLPLRSSHHSPGVDGRTQARGTRPRPRSSNHGFDRRSSCKAPWNSAEGEEQVLSCGVEVVVCSHAHRRGGDAYWLGSWGHGDPEGGQWRGGRGAWVGCWIENV